MLRVWLRLPDQSDDEAIKLLLPPDSDVSDVLVKAPAVLPLSAYRAAELVASLPTKVDPLSNRIALSQLYPNDSDNSDLTLVIGVKPQPVVMPHTTPVAAATPSTAAVSRVAGGNREGSVTSRAVPSATRTHTSIRSSSPAAVSTVRAPSPSMRGASPAPVRAPSVQRPPTAPITSSIPRATTNSSSTASPFRRLHSAQTSSLSSLNGNSAAPANNSRRPSPRPQRATSISSSDNHTATTSTGAASRAVRTTLVRHPVTTTTSTMAATSTTAAAAARKKSLAEKSAHNTSVTTTTSAAASGTASYANRSKHSSQGSTAAAASSSPGSHACSATLAPECCANFKPQWGNAVCATCKHTKQAHLLRLRAKRQQQHNETILETHLDPSTASWSPAPSPSIQKPPAHDGSRTPPQQQQSQPSSLLLGTPMSNSSTTDAISCLRRVPHAGQGEDLRLPLDDSADGLFLTTGSSSFNRSLGGQRMPTALSPELGTVESESHAEEPAAVFKEPASPVYGKNAVVASRKDDLF